MKNYLIIIFLAIIALPMVSSAATVELTGGCHYSSTTSNSVNVTFSLSNAGDFPASSVSVIPETYAMLSNINISSKSMGSIYPNITKNYTFTLSDLAFPGSYVEGMLVSYAQGSSNFFAVFPCEFNYDSQNLTNYIAPISSKYENSSSLEFGVFNIAKKPLNVTAYLIAPPEVSYLPSAINFSVLPQSDYNSSFSLKLKKLAGFSNYSTGVSLVYSYMYNGKYHSSLENLIVSSSSSKTTGISGVLIIILAFVVAVILLVSLMAFSVLHKKKTRIKQSQ